jgi:mevalonate kinase
VSAGEGHGKVILLGEHAVVYGAPALVVGLDRGARATASRARQSAIVLGGARHELEAEPSIAASRSSTSDVARAYASLLSALDERGVLVLASSELPPGGGLGSSAALGVAIARAVAGLSGRGEPERVRRAAQAFEQVFHGTSSGVDVAAALSGGCLRFSRAEGPSRAALGRGLWLALGMSGRPGGTRSMVEAVAQLRARKPEVVDRAVLGIAALVANATHALADGDLELLGQLMDLNQMLLAGLFVSTAELEELVGLARSAGALGAKLTGAGGGGAVVALVPSARRTAPDVTDDEAEASARRIVASWGERGYEGLVVRVSPVGGVAR